MECAEKLCGSNRTQVTPRAQPAWACCLSWPTDPLSVSCSSALPRRASGGGKEKRESKERRRNQRVKRKENWKREELETEERAKGAGERRGSLVFVSCLRPGTAANSSQPGAPGFPLNTTRHYYANFRQSSNMSCARTQICMVTQETSYYFCQHNVPVTAIL